MKHIKKYESFLNENYNDSIIIPVNFAYNGVDYKFELDLLKEGEVKNYGQGADFWTSFYGQDKEGGDITFDVHYCEDYNTISVYPIDMETFETDYSTTIHSQPIFSEDVYNDKKSEENKRNKSKEYYFDEIDSEYKEI